MSIATGEQILAADVNNKLALDGWIKDTTTAESTPIWLYDEDDSKVYVLGDLTSLLTIGTKIKCTNGGSTKYFSIISVPTYSSPRTGFKVTGGTAYVPYDGAMTNVYYSFHEQPVGFPEYFLWSDNLDPEGFASLTAEYCLFQVRGNIIEVTRLAIIGTTNNPILDGIKFYIPVAPVNAQRRPVNTRDNTSYTWGKVELEAASITARVYTNAGSGAFSNGVTAGVYNAEFSYRIG